jgi:cytochrome c oxidase subunit 2
MLPGKTNKFQVTTTQEGTYQGKCAELCGAYHSQMLFQVKVVPQAAYDAEITRLKSIGQTGQLPNSLNREPVLPGDQKLVPSAPGS